MPSQPGDSVHLWSINLDASLDQVNKAAQICSPEELARAARLKIPAVQRRFLTGRMSLRAILAGYLGCSPGEVQLVENPAGKPSIADQNLRTRLEFNLAHSGPWAVLAVTTGRAVGVDIEMVRPVPQAASLADRYFTPEESQTIRNAPADDRERLFLAIWVQKEAVLKALGTGLTKSLREIATNCLPVGSFDYVETGLRLHGEYLTGYAGYLAALAVQDGWQQIKYFQSDFVRI